LVLQNLDDIFKKFDEHDLLVTTRLHKANDGMKIYTGVMGFAANPKISEYLMSALYYRYGANSGNDQIALFKTLTEDIKIYSFPDEEHSINANFNSMILSSKSMGHEPGKTKLYTTDEKCEAMRVLFNERFISH
jgi:hypothetical protein